VAALSNHCSTTNICLYTVQMSRVTDKFVKGFSYDILRGVWKQGSASSLSAAFIVILQKLSVHTTMLKDQEMLVW
jgi:hypothetical protein